MSIPKIITPKSGSSENPEIAAEMTRRQFEALRLKINRKTLLTEIESLKYFKKLPKAKNFNISECSKWMRNGWNTEYILHLTPTLFSENELIYTLQWAFPQAYYSVYTILLGFLNTQGYTHKSHRHVLKLFGELIFQNKYPKTISFFAKNVKPIQFLNICKYPTSSSLHFDPDDEKSIETQICQFLKSTREMELDERRIDMRKDFKAKRTSKDKKSLNKQDWGKVSESLGNTTILNLLYRKRIKSNYRDIETYLIHNINAKEVYNNLIKIVSTLNFVHELYSAKAIGFTELNTVAENLIKKGDYAFLKERLSLVKRFISSI